MDTAPRPTAAPRSPAEQAAGTDLDGIGLCAIGEDVAAVARDRALTVGETAELVGLSVHTLRWYERIGLLDQVDRDSAGHRQYRAGDLDWLMLLIRLRATGMPVRDMIRYADLVRAGKHTAHERQLLLEDHRTRVVNQIAGLERDLAIINHKIADYRGAAAG